MDANTPTLYLAGWNSRRTPGMFGPGRAFTIMLFPRAERGQCGDGWVPILTYPRTPAWASLLHAALDERNRGIKGPASSGLRHSYRQILEGADLRPDVLAYEADKRMDFVRDGDTLACGCSVPHSRADSCHRAWAAPFLARAGWRVILDGVEVAS